MHVAPNVLHCTAIVQYPPYGTEFAVSKLKIVEQQHGAINLHSLYGTLKAFWFVERIVSEKLRKFQLPEPSEQQTP